MFVLKAAFDNPIQKSISERINIGLSQLSLFPNYIMWEELLLKLFLLCLVSPSRQCAKQPSVLRLIFYDSDLGVSLSVSAWLM